MENCVSHSESGKYLYKSAVAGTETYCVGSATDRAVCLWMLSRRHCPNPQLSVNLT